MISDVIAILGSLDTCRTGTGYLIIPVVGTLSNNPKIEKNSEVDKVFEAPLGYFLNSKNHIKRGYMRENGKEHFYYDMNWKGFRIWGATARILVNLYEILKGKDIYFV